MFSLKLNMNERIFYEFSNSIISKTSFLFKKNCIPYFLFIFVKKLFFVTSMHSCQIHFYPIKNYPKSNSPVFNIF